VETSREQSWKKLHDLQTVCQNFFIIEAVLVQRSQTYLMIYDFCGDFDYLIGKCLGMRLKIHRREQTFICNIIFPPDYGDREK
jgi:hypothetical protein